MRTFQPDPHDDRHQSDVDKRCKNCGGLYHDHHNGECEPDEQEYTPPETGAASIKITLSNSFVTVYHGSDNIVLAKGEVRRGAWDQIWATLERVGVERVKWK